MNKITTEAVNQLTEAKPGAAVSIYLPTHRYPTPPHMQEDQTRFKNLVSQAQQQLIDKGEAKLAGQLVDRLEDIASETRFWQEMTEGMAVFADKERLEFYHLPVECDERVHIGSQFDVTPLLILLSYDQPYYVLALATHQPKLLAGDMYGLAPVDIDFPASPEDALNIDEMFSNSQTRRGREGAGRLAEAIGPHGQGDSNNAGSEERLQYFRIIDGLICNSQQVDKKLPILLAAPDNDAGDYKNLSQLPKLLDEFLPGNYTVAQERELHELTWPLIEQTVCQPKADATADKFQQLAGPDKSSAKFSDIELAARNGRVDSLLVGMFDITADSVSDSNRRDLLKLTFPSVYDRLSQLARQVIAQGGRIVGLPAGSMPSAATVAALYRY
ncbi:MAG TPA: hypothetical protein VFK03_02880 [Candidatus Saccharimonadales bacterium]|nr:hypothetical protein [Candidatus Saccharimonadales bacterium]